MSDKCSKCHKDISFGEFRYSISVMKTPLCINCQKGWRNENYEGKLAKLINRGVDANRTLVSHKKNINKV